MGFLIRSALLIALILLFIPLDVSEEVPEAERVGPVQALMAARGAVQDMIGICERQPAVCETAGAALRTITARAREGLRIAQDLMAEETGEPGEENDPAATGSITPAE